MEEQEIRLECLRLALDEARGSSETTADEVQARAARYADFVLGTGAGQAIACPSGNPVADPALPPGAIPLESRTYGADANAIAAFGLASTGQPPRSVLKAGSALTRDESIRLDCLGPAVALAMLGRTPVLLMAGALALCECYVRTGRWEISDRPDEGDGPSGAPTPPLPPAGLDCPTVGGDLVE